MTKPCYFSVLNLFFNLRHVFIFILVSQVSLTNSVYADPSGSQVDCDGNRLTSKLSFNDSSQSFDYPSANSYLMRCIDSYGLKFMASPPSTIIKRNVRIGNSNLVTGSLVNGAKKASESDKSILSSAKKFGEQVVENCKLDSNYSGHTSTDDLSRRFVELCDQLNKWATMIIVEDLRDAYITTNSTLRVASSADWKQKCESNNFLSCVQILWDPKQSHLHDDAMTKISSVNDELQNKIRACQQTNNLESSQCKALQTEEPRVAEQEAPVPETSSSDPIVQAASTKETPVDATGGTTAGTTSSGDPAATLDDVANSVGQRMFGNGMGGGRVRPPRPLPKTSSNSKANYKMTGKASANQRNDNGSDSNGYTPIDVASYPLRANMSARTQTDPGGIKKQRGGSPRGGGGGGRPSPVGGSMGSSAGAGGSAAAKRPNGPTGRAPSDKPEIGGNSFMETSAGKSGGEAPQEGLDKRIKDKIAENNNANLDRAIDRNRVNASFQKGMNRAGSYPGDSFFPALYFPQVNDLYREFENNNDLLNKDGHSL